MYKNRFRESSFHIEGFRADRSGAILIGDGFTCSDRVFNYPSSFPMMSQLQLDFHANTSWFLRYHKRFPLEIFTFYAYISYPFFPQHIFCDPTLFLFLDNLEKQKDRPLAALGH